MNNPKTPWPSPRSVLPFSALLVMLALGFLALGCEEAGGLHCSRSGFLAPTPPGGTDVCTRATGIEFDLITAVQMAELSNSAFAENSGVDLGACWERLGEIESLSPYECSAELPGEDIEETNRLIIARDISNDDLVVAFSGSDGNDFFNNLRALDQVDWWFGNELIFRNSVHKGFYCYYQSIRTELTEKLVEYTNEISDKTGKRVYFTGHSLGGAQAILAALDMGDTLQTLGYSPENLVLYTFGAPRAINESLAFQLAGQIPNHFAIVDKEDQVPHFPFDTDPRLDKDYVQLPRMVVTNTLYRENDIREASILASRIECGSGWDYDGCIVLDSEGTSGYQIPESNDTARMKAIHNVELDKVRLQKHGGGIPAFSLTVSTFGTFEMCWEPPDPAADPRQVVGVCDRIALFEGDPSRDPSQCLESSPVPIAFGLGTSEYVNRFGESPESTIVAKGPNVHMAYLDGFGNPVGVVKYESEVPDNLWVEEYQDLLGFTRMKINWGNRLGDVGLHDFVAVYTEEPTDAKGNVWDWALWEGLFPREGHNNVFNNLDHSKQYWESEFSMTRRDYWIAYVTSGTGNRLELQLHPERAQILKVVKHDVPEPTIWVQCAAEPGHDDVEANWGGAAPFISDFVAYYDKDPRLPEVGPHGHKGEPYKFRVGGDVASLIDHWRPTITGDANWTDPIWLAYVRQPEFDDATAWVESVYYHIGSVCSECDEAPACGCKKRKNCP